MLNPRCLAAAPLTIVLCVVAPPLEGAPPGPILAPALAASTSPTAWPQVFDDEGLVRMQRAIAAREYFASESDGRLQAPNRAHDLRTWFEDTGIRVHDRTGVGSPELLCLALAGVGRGEVLVPVAPGEAVVAREGRVEIQRPGLVEWYLNSPRGLEQGFTLSERPAGEGPLALELVVTGARPSLVGDAVVLETQAQRRLRYGELVANDATGRLLVARLEVASPERLRIAVEDAGARYPVTIDPLLTEIADAQLESDQAFSELGRQVAGAGDVNGDGYADVIVGAGEYDAGQENEGAAFVFLGSAAGIANGNPATAAARLEGNQAGASFGQTVAGAGDVNGDGYGDVIVGAGFYDAGESNEGAAFVFLGSATGIADGNPATAATRLEGNQPDALFSFPRAAGAGDVNADGYDDVIVAAAFYDAGQEDEGAAFIFLGSAAGIADGNPASAATRLESDQAGAQLGRGAAGAGDVNGDGYADVIVSAYLYDAGQENEGAAFVFLGSAAGVADGTPATAAAQLESNQENAQLGRQNVAGAGDVNGDGYDDVIVGVHFYDSGHGHGEGMALVFLGSAAGISDGDPATAAARLEGDQADAEFGYGAAGAGDVNGDGYDDVIVGSVWHDIGQENEGAAFVFLGSSAGIVDGNPGSAAARLEVDQARAQFGYSVAGAGDVNGDGNDDVIVGANHYNAGQEDEGAAFVFLGNPDDGDGIDAGIDGQLVAGSFVDESTIFSSDIADQHLAGVWSLGTILDRAGLVVRVRDEPNPARDRVAGFRVTTSPGVGPARIRACTGSGLLSLSLPGNTSTVITCSSLIAQVLLGPIQILLGDDVVATVPTGATAIVTELAEDRFAIENSATSGGPIVIEVTGGETIELGPGESLNQIPLDVQPGEEPNAINLRKRGLIAVALPTTAAFDATGVDPLSVAFGPAGAPEAHGRGHQEDVDGDGDLDLVLHFAMAATGLACGDERVVLVGQTVAREWIEASDAIVPVGCR
jgi:hypothetical protein